MPLNSTYFAKELHQGTLDEEDIGNLNDLSSGPESPLSSLAGSGDLNKGGNKGWKGNQSSKGSGWSEGGWNSGWQTSKGFRGYN